MLYNNDKVQMIGSQQNFPTNTLFQYSGTQKHIVLTERFVDEDNTLHQSYILDPQFSVIINKKQEIAHFESKGKGKKDAPEKVQYRIQDEEPCYFYQEFYKKYNHLADFLVGRQNWSRSENSLKMSSNSVSRAHSRLSYNQSYSNKSDLAHYWRQTIKESTKYSSKWRKLSFLLLQKIAEYVAQTPYYSVEDCNSRNGTFLLNRETKRTPIKLGEQYEFQTFKYTIKPLKLIKQSGVGISEVLDNFESSWVEPCSRYFYKYEFIFSAGITRESIRSSRQLFSAIHVEIFVSYQLKFNYWLICRNQAQTFSIGYGQTLNIFPNNESEQAFRYYNLRHGFIEFEKGGWWIVAAKEQESVWTKIEAQKQYVLDTKKVHYIRIAHFSVLQLQFKHF